MENFINIVVSIIISSGIIVWLFKKYVQHNYDRKIETFKSDLTQQINNQTLSFSSFSAGQQASMERKLHAIDKLWESVIQLRNDLPSSFGLVDVLLEEEYKSLHGNKEFEQQIKSFPVDKIISIQPNIEYCRPYVGEFIWALFFAYKQIFLRIIFLLNQDIANSKKTPWYRDTAIYAVVKSVLTSKEITEFDELKFGKIQWLQKKLETKIIEEMHKIISGKSLVPDSIEQIQLIEKTVGKIKS